MTARNARILKSKVAGEHNPGYSTKTKSPEQAEQKSGVLEHSLQVGSQTSQTPFDGVWVKPEGHLDTHDEVGGCQI